MLLSAFDISAHILLLPHKLMSSLITPLVRRDNLLHSDICIVSAKYMDQYPVW